MAARDAARTLADPALRAELDTRFTDRVSKELGKPQRYGTQIGPREMATPHFGLGSDDEVRRIDENRRALGVMPLADYACMMSWLRRDSR